MKKIIQKALRYCGLEVKKYTRRPDTYEWLKKLNIQTVIDVGANIGQFASEAREKLPGVILYSFEPLSEQFEILSKKFEADKNFNCYKLGLGNKDEEIIINKSEYSPSSSILRMSEKHKTLFPHTVNHSEEKIKVTTLDKFFAEIILDKEILIKIDVQGFEDKVIAGGKNIFTEAKAVIVETSFVELYEGQPKFDDIYYLLKNYGFLYHGSMQKKTDKVTGEIISEDSLFIRKNPGI